MRLHYNGVGYYYTNQNGQQLTRMYKRKANLYRFHGHLAKYW